VKEFAIKTPIHSLKNMPNFGIICKRGITCDGILLVVSQLRVSHTSLFNAPSLAQPNFPLSSLRALFQSAFIHHQIEIYIFAPFKWPGVWKEINFAAGIISVRIRPRWFQPSFDHCGV